MKHRCIRLSTLWRVPVYVLAANYLCSVLVLCGAVSFYTVRYTGADGAVCLYVDPIRGPFSQAGCPWRCCCWAGCSSSGT